LNKGLVNSALSLRLPGSSDDYETMLPTPRLTTSVDVLANPQIRVAQREVFKGRIRTLSTDSAEARKSRNCSRHDNSNPTNDDFSLGGMCLDVLIEAHTSLQGMLYYKRIGVEPGQRIRVHAYIRLSFIRPRVDNASYSKLSGLPSPARLCARAPIGDKSDWLPFKSLGDTSQGDKTDDVIAAVL